MDYKKLMLSIEDIEKDINSKTWQENMSDFDKIIKSLKKIDLNFDEFEYQQKTRLDIYRVFLISRMYNNKKLVLKKIYKDLGDFSKEYKIIKLYFYVLDNKEKKDF